MDNGQGPMDVFKLRKTSMNLYQSVLINIGQLSASCTHILVVKHAETCGSLLRALINQGEKDHGWVSGRAQKKKLLILHCAPIQEAIDVLCETQ